MKILIAYAEENQMDHRMKQTVESVLETLQMEISQVQDCTVEIAKRVATHYDVIFCPLSDSNVFNVAKWQGTKVIGLRNVFSHLEMEQKLRENGVA